ncbi:hypothetical protein JCM14469_17650 [Desulfatiferula olefinivorans]
MYIARSVHKGENRFSIRESYADGGVYRSRRLMDLGPDPRRFVHYPHGRSYYIDSVVEDTLRAAVGPVNPDDLDEMFWPFVRPEIRRLYAGPRSRRSGDGVKPDVSAVHVFDKRRMSFLRTGCMNQRHIDKAPAALFRPLVAKSRDELEQAFIRDEAALSSKEIKAYVYVIFDIQRHFTALIAREMPQGLDQDKVEDHLLDDLCGLNGDPSFWAGMDMTASLHPYLIRYLLMFFDFEYQASRLFENLEFARFNRRRYHRQTDRPADAVMADAAAVFGLSASVLKAMGRRDIQRLYRKKAAELHPDRGGTHEAFIDLGRIYDELIRSIKS